MESYPDYETYQALYARYYDRGVAELLKLLEPLDGTNVLDLCGGDGRLTLKALESGAKEVILVDAEPKMVPSLVWNHKQVRVVINKVHLALSNLIRDNERFDRIVCQQAVTYWLNEGTAERIAQVLKPGGFFVFNTFNQKPPEKPRVLEYELDGHSFVEVSWLVGDKVHHLQVRDGLEPHYTAFLWLSPERLRALLEPYFVVKEERHEKTSLYRCER